MTDTEMTDKEMTDEEIKRLIAWIRKTVPSAVAEGLVEVQPMPPVDLEAIAKHPLWQSYVDRHFKKEE